MSNQASQKWFLVVNPQAGGGKGQRKWKSIQNLLDKMGLDYDFVLSQAPQQAIVLSREAVERGYRQIVAVGGDGTLNEVLNGLMLQRVCSPAELRLGIIPVGTGNDWIKTHKIPADYKKAILVLQAGRTQAQDIGLVHYQNDLGEAACRYFINVAGLGYDAFVTYASQTRKRWFSSTLFYFYLIITASFRYRPQVLRVRFDGELRQGLFYSIALGLCRYNGGGAQFVPHAEPFDGRFALTLIDRVSLWDLLVHAPKFYNGKIGQHRAVELQQCAYLEVEGETGLEVDGEYLGRGSARFELLPQALPIICP